VFDTHLNIVDENGTVTHEGDILFATNDPHMAFAHAECIIITLPPTMMKKIADIIYKHGNPHAIIGVVPGNGGSECAFAKCIKRGNIFFGLERTPAIARLVEKGKTVRSVGYRKELHIASIPACHVVECCSLVEGIYYMPCKVIPNFLNLTMTPSNPILHTARLRTIFKDYRTGIVYDKLPLFYEEWDDESSELLFACDEEVQQICRALPEFDLHYVKSLKNHYESKTVHEMTRKISGIPAFKGLCTPSHAVDGGYIPDLSSRYFTADFAYGLSVIKQIGDFAGVSTPNIDETMSWYENLAVEHDRFRYSDYGINTREDFVRFYLEKQAQGNYNTESL
jgi:hypothetical protein